LGNLFQIEETKFKREISTWEDNDLVIQQYEFMQPSRSQFTKMILKDLTR